MLDVLIRHGRVIDGSGAPWFRADVGIKDGVIVYMGSDEPPEALKQIDATGKFVCPGFIDIHSHADISIIRSPEREPKITQGVTTEVFSNCGGGIAPVTAKSKQLLLEYNKKLRFVDFDWFSTEEYLSRIDGAGVNVAYLVPHGVLRIAAMGYDARHATREEIQVMCDLARAGMADGAFGLSTGLAYVPMSSSATEEIVEICKVVADHGGFVASHMRNYREKVTEGVDEMLCTARESGIPMHIAHYQAYGVCNWGRGEELRAWIDDARNSGLDVTFDSYPYDFSAGGLKNTIPAKYHDRGAQGLAEYLKQPEVRKALQHEIGTVTTYDLERLTIVGVTNPELSEFIGKSLPEGAEIRGQSVIDFLCDVLIQDTAISHVNFQGNAADVRVLARSAYHMVGSDSSDVVRGEARPHPRLYGTFPRFLRMFAAEDSLLTWESAINKMTGLPAWRLGLSKRGLLKRGMAGDVVVFDPETIRDKATMLDPEQPAEGIEWVLVNGVIELAESKMTQCKAGKVLRRGMD